jgi:succinate dehydrogenase / fumarate reductase iron-sulfur subunit
MKSRSLTPGEATAQMVTLRIKRFNPAVERHPRWVRYAVLVKPKMSVLDALFEILEHQEGTLGFRYSCRAEMCGSCAIVINGRERLACGTRLNTLGKTITVEPLRAMPIIKDLVVDMEPFFSKYAAIQPYFVGDGTTEPAVISPESRLRQGIDPQLDCITCGACFSACPIVATNPHYLGPAALNRAYTLVGDVRDTAANSRLATVTGEDGIYCCRNAASCIEVCPAGIEPLFSIQRLRKRALVL